MDSDVVQLRTGLDTNVDNADREVRLSFLSG